jgi:hypothetical protein
VTQQPDDIASDLALQMLRRAAGLYGIRLDEAHVRALAPRARSAVEGSALFQRLDLTAVEPVMTFAPARPGQGEAQP